MPDFDVLTLLDIKIRKKQFSGKRKNGNFKQNIKLTFRFKYPLKFWTSSNAF